MIEIGLYLAFLFVVGVAAASLSRRPRWFDALAAPLGLVARSGTLVGQVDGLDVELSWRSAAGLTVKVRAPAPFRFGLRPLGESEAAGRATGDPVLDGMISPSGVGAPGVSVLDADARAVVTSLLSAGGHVAGDVAVIEGPGPFTASEVRELIGLGVAAIRTLARDEAGMVERLVGLASSDPNPGVRRRALELLFTVTDDPVAERFLSRLLTDRSADPFSRRLAAEWSSYQERARCVEEWLSDPAMRVVGLEAANEVRRDVGDEVLRDVLSDGDPRGRIAAAEAAGRLRRPVEVLLWPLLRDPATAAAGIRALAEVGTVRSVEPLSALAELGAGEVRGLAREAVLRIQSGVSEAERGGLSVAPPADQRGAVSLPRRGGGLSKT